MVVVSYRIKETESFSFSSSLPADKSKELIATKLGSGEFGIDGYCRFERFPQMHLHTVKASVLGDGAGSYLTVEMSLTSGLKQFVRLFPFILGGLVVVMFLGAFLKAFSILTLMMALLILLTFGYGYLGFAVKTEIKECQKAFEFTFNMYEKMVGGGVLQDAVKPPVDVAGMLQK